MGLFDLVLVGLSALLLGARSLRIQIQRSAKRASPSGMQPNHGTISVIMTSV